MTQEPSIYKPLLHWDGHLSAAFFHKEDAMIFDLSSVASDEILGTVSQENGQSVPATFYAAHFYAALIRVSLPGRTLAAGELCVQLNNHCMRLCVITCKQVAASREVLPGRQDLQKSATTRSTAATPGTGAET